MPVFREYPKVLYFSDGRTQLVANLTEETAQLAAGWSLVPVILAHGVTRVPASTVEGNDASVIVLPNTKLQTLKFVNDSPAVCKFVYGAGAAADNFSWILDPGERWEMPLVTKSGETKPEYTGLITAFWASAVGYMQVTLTEVP